MSTLIDSHRLLESSGALQAEQAAEIARLKQALAQKDEEVVVLMTRPLKGEFSRASRMVVGKEPPSLRAMSITEILAAGD